MIGLDKFSLAGQTVVITGASSGIGRAAAIASSHVGADVVLVGRSEDELNRTAEKCASDGGALIVSADLTDKAAPELIAQRTLDAVGRISGFVHCAGIQKITPLRAMRSEVYERTFAINVVAGFELARVLSKKKYLAEDGASFVFVSSVMGLLGQPSLAAYCASKGALVSGVKSLAVELASKQIRVNSVCPGSVRNTKMSDRGFDVLPSSSREAIENMHCLGTGETDDVAYPIVFLLSAAARWMTGSAMVIDGGYSAQ